MRSPGFGILAVTGLALGLVSVTFGLQGTKESSLAGPYHVFAVGLSRDEAGGASQPTATNTLIGTPTNTPTPTPSPTPTATPGPGTTITSITSPIHRGSMASLTAHTSPGAYCTITYSTPSGATSSATGLVPMYVGSSGYVSWSWLIASSTTAGTGQVTVTCGIQSTAISITIT